MPLMVLGEVSFKTLGHVSDPHHDLGSLKLTVARVSPDKIERFLQMHYRNFGCLFSQCDLDGELQGTISLRRKLEAKHGLEIFRTVEEFLALLV